VSLLDGALFDKLDAVARGVRKKPQLPFGGIQVAFVLWQVPARTAHTDNPSQLVFTGDFFQLPPVVAAGQPVSFAFESQSWKAGIQAHYTLTRVFRQKDSRERMLFESVHR
jgi:ATP-dependent DNA helicase PIF1